MESVSRLRQFFAGSCVGSRSISTSIIDVLVCLILQSLNGTMLLMARAET